MSPVPAPDPVSPDSGGANPSTLSRLMAVADNSTDDVADSTDAVISWDTAIELVGTDLEIDGLDATKINVLTDGVYAVSFNVNVQTLSGAKFTEITPELNVNPSDTLGNWFVDPILTVGAGLTRWGTNLVFIYFMAAGTVLGADVFASTDTAADWRLMRPSTRILVQRLI